MVRLVIDTFNFAAIFDWSDYAPEINNGARAGYVAHPRLKRRLCHQNFANDICHALKLLATVTPSALSSHKRRYKNEYESMSYWHDRPRGDGLRLSSDHGTTRVLC